MLNSNFLTPFRNIILIFATKTQNADKSVMGYSWNTHAKIRNIPNICKYSGNI